MMIEVTSNLRLEQSVNLFNIILILAFPTAILEAKNKAVQILSFAVALVVLMTTINTYYILDLLENIVATAVVYLYCIIALKASCIL